MSCLGGQDLAGPLGASSFSWSFAICQSLLELPHACAKVEADPMERHAIAGRWPRVTFSAGLVQREYRPAEKAVGQQVIKLDH